MYRQLNDKFTFLTLYTKFHDKLKTNWTKYVERANQMWHCERTAYNISTTVWRYSRIRWSRNLSNILANIRNPLSRYTQLTGFYEFLSFFNRIKNISIWKRKNCSFLYFKDHIQKNTCENCYVRKDINRWNETRK